MAIVKVGWSGGKDSTATVLLHLQRGDKVKAVCYIPMFTKEIPLILKDHYQFILRAADYFRSLGAEVYIVSGMTYWDYVTHIKTKGKDKGNIMGFPAPITGMCTFKTYSKNDACKKADKVIGYYDYESLGIAFDEVKRHGQLNNKKRSILVEEGFCESDCLRLCVSKNLLSPHYQHEMRDGCTVCPNAGRSRRLLWFNEFPEAIPLLVELQDIVKQRQPEKYPLRGHRWFIEPNYQLSFFEEEKYIIN